MRLALTLSLAAIMMAIPAVAQTKTQKGTDDGGVAEAVRFERAKAAAAARQAQIEAKQPCGCASPTEAAAAAEKKPASQQASSTKPKK